ncbi:MAG: hypothetical protein GX256_10215 [Fretibacterium sp.]|nr:hypothetical protein [Fretibacterium sp.]
MDDKGEIVSACDVDENVALQVWTKGLSPRIVLLNKNKATRKLIRLGWFEKLDRKLTLKGKKRGQSITYLIEDLVPTLRRILSEYAVYTSFRPKHWKFSLELEKSLNVPEIVTEKSDLLLMSEEKRSSLWLSDLTGENKKKGVFRPFFPYDETEVLALSLDLSIEERARELEDLLKTGVLRALAAANPARWHNPVKLTAAAMLLGFSFCGEDGSDMTDSLWRGDDSYVQPGLTPVKKGYSLDIHDPRMVGLGEKLSAYVRHFKAVDSILMRTSWDSDKELLDMEYVRKRRIPFPEGALGEAPYSVTFFEGPEENVALGCKAKGVAVRQRDEIIYTFPLEVYEQALVHDSVGGPPDEFFTIMQLVRAYRFKEWLGEVGVYISSFVGLI